MKSSVGYLALFVYVALTVGCVHSNDTYNLWDVGATEVVSLERVAPRLARAHIMFLGETHDRPSHHQAQLEIIRAIHSSGKKVAVGLEMFQHKNQSILDRWVSGEMPEREFAEHFRGNWGELWPLYRDIFIFCRSNGIPVVGLNVPKEITSRVAREGFASLSREQVGELPIVACRVDPQYLELLRGAHGHGMNDVAFERFCEAQLVWDTAMATYALEYLKEHSDRELIVLAGSVHAWKKGIPAQIVKTNPDQQLLVILPESQEIVAKGTASQADCDYLLLGL